MADSASIGAKAHIISVQLIATVNIFAYQVVIMDKQHASSLVLTFTLTAIAKGKNFTYTGGYMNLKEKLVDMSLDVIKWWLIIAFAALAVYLIMPESPWWRTGWEVQ